MSIRLMALVWEVPFPTQSQKLIALKLADYASDAGDSIFPANATLAAYGSCDESTVKRSMKAFRECGLLHLVQEGGKGPRATNQWRLNVQMLAALAYGDCTITGSSAALEIAGDVAASGDENKGFKKGFNLHPSGELRGSPEPVRGSPVHRKGFTGEPQSTINSHIDSPGAHVRERDENAPASRAEKKSTIAIEIKIDESCFDSWIEHMRAAGNEALAASALAAGCMTVSSRWPKEGSAMPKVASAATLTTRSRAMTGE